MSRDEAHSHHHGHHEEHRAHRLRAVAPTGDKKLVAQFSEGTIKVIAIADLIKLRPALIALSKDEVVRDGKIEEEGLVVRWSGDLEASAEVLWNEGVEVDTPFDELLAISEAAKIWNVSRTAISQDIGRGAIHEGIDAVNFGKQWVLTRNAMLRVYGEPE